MPTSSHMDRLSLRIPRNAAQHRARLLLFLLGVLMLSCSAVDQVPAAATASSEASHSPSHQETRHKDDHGKQPPSRRVPASMPRQRSAHGTSVQVTHVIDGDTIGVVLRGEEKDIRLIGVDTPETVHPTEPDGCFGAQASAFTKSILESKDVVLEFDVEKHDFYGRTLAYVWTGSTLFNETLLRRGFAQVSTYPPNVKYVNRFVSAQRKAHRHALGLWQSCDNATSSLAHPTSSQSPQGVRTNKSDVKCDQNYHGSCIPTSTSDIDCPQVAATNFRSVGADPHGFDEDGDGIACEA